jgi:hypothetical protein
MFHERGKLPTERGGMSSAQVDFVAPAVHAELHGLVRRAPRQVVLKLYVDTLHYVPPAAPCLGHLTHIDELAVHIVPMSEQMYQRRPRMFHGSYRPGQASFRP